MIQVKVHGMIERVGLNLQHAHELHLTAESAVLDGFIEEYFISN